MIAAALGLLVALQVPAAQDTSTLRPVASVARAVRAETPPVLDGRDDDPVWKAAPVIGGFLVVRPKEGADPHFRTEGRVAYDEHNLYVFIRAFDPHPDSIVRLLSRRDNQTDSDQLIVMIDGFHDRRTGYEFAVNPVGVKADYAIYQDGNEDGAWDAVWDVSTQVDSLGWTAEYRIPLSQLKYSAGSGTGTFGFALWRSIERFTEASSWPLIRQSKVGFVSQFGDLTGLDSLASPHRAEITPYVVVKNETRQEADGSYSHPTDITAGGDVKYGLSSNLTLNATINPDFGQVEADPSVLNLSAFETFFPERRPFFVEGKGVFDWGINCSAVNCNGENMFYSRRIGRAPQLSDHYGDASSPTATTILGAAKITGRLPGGLALGVLDAVTQRETGVSGATIEPTTNYALVRLSQEAKGGEGAFGAMVSAVNRSLDQWTDTLLRQSAYTAAADFRHRLFKDHYEISGSFDLSRVAGTPEAILLAQQDPVHLYQRPDGVLRVDSTATTMSGDAEEIRFGKVSGDRTHFETSYSRRSPGFEVNDMGFLLQADQQSWSNWFMLKWRKPTSLYQSVQWNFNWWQWWSTAGLPTERAFNTNVHAQFNNRWWLHLGGTLGQLGSTFCDRCARGGPAIRQDLYASPWMFIEGDGRQRLVPFIGFNGFIGDGGRSHNFNVNPELDFKISSRFNTSISASYNKNVSDAQWFNNYTDSLDNLHYTFAHLDQQTLSFTFRLDYTFSRTASLQIYAQPYVSKGTYSNIRELDQPRADAYDDRYKVYGDTAITNNPGGFNFKQFNSNVVFRWEYRRGSTLFLVWNQGRSDFTTIEGDKNFGGNYHDLFQLHPMNTFLIKASYWINW
ncbi:MAG TPA: DUF5916 domain-containing protein [Gemmatimonadales bacterium]|nr:DUF5916 domain-containing protein [Gemmatimonadales bacterium]